MCLTFHYRHYGHPAACKLDWEYHPPPQQMHLISLSSRRIHSSTIHPSRQDHPGKINHARGTAGIADINLPNFSSTTIDQGIHRIFPSV
jgi:hypothetical protein